MKTKKSKFFKAFGFTSLALLVGFGTTMAFAPLGATPSVASATEMSTQASESLIVPKKDDPVIFTTESGIEIKWGNAANSSGGGKETGSYSVTSYTGGVGLPSNSGTQNLSSGNLSGFPYFTTKSGSTTYTWVIIGRNSNVSSMNSGNTLSGNVSSTKTEYKTLSDWKSKITNSDTYANFINGYSPTYKTFFNNTYETSTPAGAAINNNGLLNQTTARDYSVSTSYSYTKMMTLSNVKTSTEIPAGCVLCLSNSLMASVQYYTAGAGNTYAANIWDTFSDSIMDGGSNYCAVRMQCFTYTSSDSFGFGSNFSLLQKPSLTQRTYSNSGGTHNTTVTTLKFFPLGGSNYTSENFKWETYLTAAQYKSTSNVWCRGMYNSSSPYYVNTSGTLTYFSDTHSTAYIRPACVLKVQ